MNRTKALLISCTALVLLGGACTFNPSLRPGEGAGGVRNPLGFGGRPGLGGRMMVGCMGIECQQATSSCTKSACPTPPPDACPTGTRTTISGIIRDPAGRVPLYNINVYVPNAPLAPINDGPSCDPCDPTTGTSLLSGSPIVQAVTDATGHFTLGGVNANDALKWQGDVPVGDNIPLVIQVGKWRRQVMIPTVTACTDNMVTDTDLLRLPKNQAEGHIPKMALTTGNLDALECLLRKIGIDDTEFTTETGTGRVNFYAGGGGTSSYAATLNGGAAFTPIHPTGGGTDWWDSLDNLKKYDILLHSCEGMYGQFGPNQQPTSVKSVAARQALQDFADMGGRVFGSHWHVYWFEQGTQAFQSIATFNHNAGLSNPYDATIDTNFDKGTALADWLYAATNMAYPRGTLHITGTASSRTVDAVAGGQVSQRWIYANTLTPKSVLYLSATTPIFVPTDTSHAPACGRVVFSDLHVSGGSGSSTPNTPFPMGCTTGDLSPQEKALEFMLFDIASCVSIIPIPG